MKSQSEIEEWNSEAFHTLLNWAISSDFKKGEIEGLQRALLHIEHAVQEGLDSEIESLVLFRINLWAQVVRDFASESEELQLAHGIFDLSLVISLGLPRDAALRFLKRIGPDEKKLGYDYSVSVDGICHFRKTKMFAFGTHTDFAAKGHRKVNEADSLTITITFKGKSPASRDIGFLIFAFSELFSLIENTEAKLADVGTGSFWFKLKVNLRDFFQRKEVKKTLELARDAVQAKFAHQEIEKSRKLEAERVRANAERVKLETEQKLLEQQVEENAADSRKSQFESQMNDLKLRRELAEIRAVEISNSKEYLDLKMKAAAMIRDGILSADPVEIFVNDDLLLRAKGGKIERGEDISVGLDESSENQSTSDGENRDND